MNDWDIFLAAVFWMNLFVILYTYFLYPGLLGTICAFVRRPFENVPVGVQPGEEFPSVTMVISAYNEEAVLPEKIANCLKLDYPRGKLTFLVGSDGSTDRTPAILQGIVDPRFAVRCFDQRRGKVQVLNDLLHQARSDIVLFSDANTIYEPAAIRELVKPFKQKKVGCVIGRLDLIVPGGDPLACRTESLYWRYENAVKRLESRLGIVPTINGGIFAVRRELYEPLPPQAITEDQVLGMNIMVRGYRCVFAEAARAAETVSPLSGELRRRIRISAGNFQSLFLVKGIFRCGGMSFAFFSHKLLRWCVPFCLLAVLIANGLLAGRVFYGLTLLVQLFFYACGILGSLLPTVGQGLKVLLIPKYFLAMNLAILIGFSRFLTGRQHVTWTKGR